jgi:hypothetical protein
MRLYWKSWSKKLTVATVALAALAPPAQAGPILDWLFGVHQGPAVPTGPPVPVGTGYGGTAYYPYYAGYGPAGIPQTAVAHLPTAGYSTQLNRAPITYYRPVTSLDPATGTTVTRLQPCTSYELQAQRVPMLAMRPTLGSYPVTGRFPTLTAPAYGAIPVPSNPIPTFQSPSTNTAIPMVNQMPVTGMPIVPGYTSPSLLQPSSGQSVQLGYWPSVSGYGFQNYGAVVPAASYPTYASGYAGDTNASQHPTNASYGASYGTCYGGNCSGTGSVIPGTGSVMQGTGSGMPGTSGSVITPAPTYGTIIPGPTSMPGPAATTSPFGAGPLGTAPAFGAPGFNTPGSLATPPGPVLPRGTEGVADPESSVRPSLNQSGSTQEPRFRMQMVEREHADRERDPSNSSGFANSSMHETPKAPDLLPSADDPWKLTPIPAQDRFPPPGIVPGLLDPRDRTAYHLERPHRSFDKIRWVSSSASDHEASDHQSKNHETGAQTAIYHEPATPSATLEPREPKMGLRLQTSSQPSELPSMKAALPTPKASQPRSTERYDSRGWSAPRAAK